MKSAVVEKTMLALEHFFEGKASLRNQHHLQNTNKINIMIFLAKFIVMSSLNKTFRD
jgi:hypothetical protein